LHYTYRLLPYTKFLLIGQAFAQGLSFVLMIDILAKGEIYFNDAFGSYLSLERIKEEIVSFMNGDPEREYKIIIGTDSEVLGNQEADFITAIVVYRKGNGGRYFWRRIKGGRYHTLRDRIIDEVMVSLDSAKLLLDHLKNIPLQSRWEFEIHVDIGQNGPSRNLIQEVTAIVRASNFEAKTKPESYAASKVADRHC